MRTTFYEGVEALQTDLDEWLRFYDEGREIAPGDFLERPHLGYRNMGRRPLDTISLYLQGETDAAAAEPGAANGAESAPILATFSARHEG